MTMPPSRWNVNNEARLVLATEQLEAAIAAITAVIELIKREEGASDGDTSQEC